jgi:RHS repeat-associated protein
LRKHIDYDAFGNVTGYTHFDRDGAAPAPPSDWVDQLFYYTGQQRDEATGLQLHGARWYSPTTGRFLNEDPIGFDGGDPNLYRYVGNSPINGYDPTGLTQAGNPLNNIFGGTTYNPYAGSLATSSSPIFTQPRPSSSPGLSLGTLGSVLGNSIYNSAPSYFAPTTRSALSAGVSLVGAGLSSTAPGYSGGQTATASNSPGWLQSAGNLVGAIWNAGKIWDNAEVAQNYQNLRDAGYSGPSAGIVGVVGGVGERSFVSRIANAAEGRTAAGDPLSGWQRVGEGTIGVGQGFVEVAGGKIVNSVAGPVVKFVTAGLDNAAQFAKGLFGGVAKTADDVGSAASRVQQHHLMTNKNSISNAAGGPFTPKFEKLAARRGITLEDAVNKVGLADHMGPHPAYNAKVYQHLKDATSGLKGSKFNAAFDKALDQVRTQTLKPGTTLNKLATGQGGGQ